MLDISIVKEEIRPHIVHAFKLLPDRKTTSDILHRPIGKGKLLYRCRKTPKCWLRRPVCKRTCNQLGPPRRP